MDDGLWAVRELSVGTYGSTTYCHSKLKAVVSLSLSLSLTLYAVYHHHPFRNRTVVLIQRMFFFKERSSKRKELQRPIERARCDERFLVSPARLRLESRRDRGDRLAVRAAELLHE